MTEKLRLGTDEITNYSYLKTHVLIRLLSLRFLGRVPVKQINQILSIPYIKEIFQAASIRDRRILELSRSFAD